MLDRSKIGYEFEPFHFDIEKGQLRFFAKAIGETNSIYFDESAAQAAGYKTLPAPPTFMFSIDLHGPDFIPMLKLLDMEISRILHGSQEFEYLGQIYAGDTITQSARILDIFDKKGGALEFVVQESHYINQHNEVLGKAVQTIIYRH